MNSTMKILRSTHSILILRHTEKADLQEELQDVHIHLHVHRMPHNAAQMVAS